MIKYLYRELTWMEVNQAVRNRRVVLIPVGAIEQHGPHLPIDTDNLLVEQVCERAARRAPEILLCAPPIHYGYNEHNMDFPGTVSIGMETFLNYCYDLGESLSRQGFRRILWVNGHGSNSELCSLIARKVTCRTEALSAAVNYWEAAYETIEAVCEGGPEGRDHACEFETSLYLHLRPELVQQDTIADERAGSRGGPEWLYPSLTGGTFKFMNFWSRMTDSGVNGSPSLASAAKGEAIAEAAVSALVRFCREFRELNTPPRVDHKESGGEK